MEDVRKCLRRPAMYQSGKLIGKKDFLLRGFLPSPLLSLLVDVAFQQTFRQCNGCGRSQRCMFRCPQQVNGKKAVNTAVFLSCQR